MRGAREIVEPGRLDYWSWPALWRRSSGTPARNSSSSKSQARPAPRRPTLHCPDTDCTPDREINQGPVVEMKTRRTYFLDYPCDLKPGEKVTFILSIHGAGSYGNWQRHYFPLLDYVDKYRLVVATPNSPTHIWSTADDEYLQNIVTSVVDQIGKQNIKAFWLVGHSQGGMTSNRLAAHGFLREPCGRLAQPLRRTPGTDPADSGQLFPRGHACWRSGRCGSRRSHASASECRQSCRGDGAPARSSRRRFLVHLRDGRA